MLKVFLVDDEYYERLSLKNNIPWEEHGMEVSGEANNGKSAFDLICDNPPQIAIVDINMPGLTGLELIEKLGEEQISCRYIILTGYDEFKYAQQAIRLGVFDYVLKPINYQTLSQTLDELRGEIEQQDSALDHLNTLQNENDRFYLERYYNDLVNCNFTIQSMKEYDHKLMDNLLMGYELYEIIVLELINHPPVEKVREIREKIEERIKNYRMICCMDNKNRLFFICDGKNGPEFSKFAQQILKLAEEYECQGQIGAGNAYPGFEQIYLSYNEACIALQNCRHFKQNLLRYEDIHTPVFGHSLDIKKRNTIKTLIFKRDTRQLKEELESIYDIMENERISWDGVVLQTLELINFLTENLSGQVSSPISVLDVEGNVLDTLYAMHETGQVRDWLVQIYNTSIMKILEGKEDYSDITICVEKYITEHYDNPELTIADISKNLFLNYSYICYCFKRDKQMTINDYISKIRIEKAIELFQDHIDNVSYVAEKTGFGSASYFSKQFKRATGLPPTDYIKTLQ